MIADENTEQQSQPAKAEKQKKAKKPREPVAADAFLADDVVIARDLGVSQSTFHHDLRKRPGSPVPVINNRRCVRWVKQEWRDFMLAERARTQAEPKLRLAMDVRRAA